MKFGCCINMIASGEDKIGAEHIGLIKQAGYDYLEMPLAEITQLSDSAFDILYSIVDLGDGCSQSDICKYSCLSKQTVNSSIKKMVSLNYLTFKPGKGRVMQIFLTDKGRQLLDEKICPIIKKENEAFLCMTDEECRLMLELYEKYNNALKNKFKEL